MAKLDAMNRVEIWFEFGSTYSYPAVMRIREAARVARVEVDWKVFLLGPIFRDLGWKDSPFNLQPAKGRYMWRDLARICDGYGLPLRRPSVFPRSGLLAARVAVACRDAEWLPTFVERIYRANFAEDREISERGTVASCLDEVGVDGEAVLTSAQTDEVKAALRRQTEEARRRGIFGAPSFLVGEELFWGNDRLEAALACARGWPETPTLGDQGHPPAAIEAIERSSRSMGFDMASDRATGALLRSLVAAKPDGRFLEIGTGTGLATAWLADGMHGAATLLTIDSDASVVDVARRHLGGDARITFEVADGGETLAALVGSYDLIFADAWPGKFDALERALSLLAPGGLYVIDDLLPQPNWPDGHGEKVRVLLDRLEQRRDLEIVRLDWSTGILVAARSTGRVS